MFHSTDSFFANYVMAINLSAQNLQNLAELSPEYLNEQNTRKSRGGLRDRRPSLFTRLKQFILGIGHR